MRGPLDDGVLERWAREPLTYDEVGATAGPLPRGFHHLRRARTLGTGRDLFDRTSATLLSLGMQRAAASEVRSTDSPVVVGSVVVARLRIGPVHVDAPCRVVAVVDEADRRGFAYGTLRGHPVAGEERFEVALGADGSVTAVVTAFSRPARWFTRLGGAVGRLAQQQMARRYLRALT